MSSLGTGTVTWHQVVLALLVTLPVVPVRSNVASDNSCCGVNRKKGVLASVKGRR